MTTQRTRPNAAGTSTIVTTVVNNGGADSVIETQELPWTTDGKVIPCPPAPKADTYWNGVPRPHPYIDPLS